MKWLSLETNERKNIALWMMFGGAVIFTIYACVGLWLLSSVANYVFWLAVIAHLQIFSIMTGYIAQLIKRRVVFNKSGVSITDDGFDEWDVQTKSKVNGQASGSGSEASSGGEESN